MVTVRQLLELMHEDDLVSIINNETEDDEFAGSVKKCKDCIPNAVLDCAVAKIFSGVDYGLYIYREVRK